MCSSGGCYYVLAGTYIFSNQSNAGTVIYDVLIVTVAPVVQENSGVL